MILVDTSIWIDHLWRGNHQLAELLNDGRVLALIENRQLIGRGIG